MTMDMNVRGVGLSLNAAPRRHAASSSPTSPGGGHPPFSPSLPTSTQPTRNIKRSFDVAFLMAPDEKFARKQQEKLRLVATGSLLKSYNNPSEGNPNGNAHQLSIERSYQQNFYSIDRNKSFASIDIPKNYSYKNNDSFESEITQQKCNVFYQDKLKNGDDQVDEYVQKSSAEIAQRSAFTKVTPLSPRSLSSLSPDHVNYQGSMSPASNRNESPAPQNYQKHYQNPMVSITSHVTPSQGRPVNCTPFLLQTDTARGKIVTSETHRNAITATGNFRAIDSYLLKANANSVQNYYNQCQNEKELMSTNFINNNVNKIRSNLLYNHPEAMAYSTLAAAYPFGTSFTGPSGEMLRPSLLQAASNPAVAAAVVSASLLPSSFATFSLPAQNVCAKCNISFRMTSDLVYHMRSHHKGDNASVDPSRRRRDQDKLKCPVCSESFRERHHLTRHMTAHQDKAGDLVDNEDDGEMVDASRMRAGGRMGVLPEQRK